MSDKRDAQIESLLEALRCIECTPPMNLADAKDSPDWWRGLVHDMKKQAHDAQVQFCLRWCFSDPGDKE